MSKPKKHKKSDEKCLALVLLITAITDLIKTVIEIINNLLD